MQQEQWTQEGQDIKERKQYVWGIKKEPWRFAKGQKLPRLYWANVISWQNNLVSYSLCQETSNQQIYN